jgi:hypothetical protein
MTGEKDLNVKFSGDQGPNIPVAQCPSSGIHDIGISDIKRSGERGSMVLNP